MPQGTPSLLCVKTTHWAGALIRALLRLDQRVTFTFTFTLHCYMRLFSFARGMLHRCEAVVSSVFF